MKNGFENGFKVIGTPTQGLRGLVLWLKFNEGSGSVAKDSSFYNNHGTIHGAQWVEGRFKSALRFDGIDDYVDCGDIDDVDGVREITVTAWVKWEGATGNLTTPKEFHRKNNVYALGGGWADHKARFWIYYTKWANSGDSTTDIDDGNWHFVVGVYDGEYIRLYVDGVEETKRGLTSVTLNANNEHVIVGSSKGVGEFWNGIIDEVRIYNRALSENEIKMLYYNRIGAVPSKVI
ncbi:hypothetical protein DRP04_06875 [Archaeoglobales archaeon]|nr:MAG: hypothetical protein DRP04_06875 [Archaeoglobales archaeon]